MKVMTFDLLSGKRIRTYMRGLTINKIATLITEDGKTIVRHLDRCQYDRKELEEWMKK